MLVERHVLVANEGDGANGGLLYNNSNTQARGGGAVIDGTTMVLDDRKWSMQQNPGPYTLGGNQDVYAVRVETGGSKGTQSEPVQLRNLDIRGLLMQISSSLINFEGSAPAESIRNCRITNHIDVPSLLAVSPGSQGGYEAAAQTNVLVDQCLLTGSTWNSPRGRRPPVVTHSKILYPDT